MFRGAQSGVSLWRLAAVALLLCAVFDIAFVDTALLTGTISCCDSDSDQCFCCCRHIVATTPFLVRPYLSTTAVEVPQSPAAESVPSPLPYHPPRA